MRVLLDSNVVVDALQAREPHVAQAVAVLEKAAREEVDACVTAKQATDIYYLMNSALHSKAEAAKLLEGLLKIIDVVDTLAVDVMRSLLAGYPDFEDGVMIATAERMGLDAIVTRDAKGFKLAKVPVHTPAEFLELLNR